MDMANSTQYMDAWRLVEEIKQISRVFAEKFNYMFVSMHAYNALSMSDDFFSYFGNDEIEGITEVGSIAGYTVFLDMHMRPDEILLSCDLASSREYKIDQILEGKEFHKERRVKIWS
jgi:hypothetical protein